MNAGRKWPAECREYTDPVSGARVRQLTDHRGHSHHLYFTNPGWHDGGRRLLFGSDRHNRPNLFSVELATGEISQLTDLEQDTGFLSACVNPTREEAYFSYDRTIVALDLQSHELQELWTIPGGFRQTMMNCTADGAYVCAGIAEDVSDRIDVPLRYSYAGFRETMEAHPLCQIVRIGTDGSGADLVWEEKTYINHVNTSPTQAHLLTFCHEGPWEYVDHRIWGLDLNAGKAWKIRPCEGDETVGHEYWHADGEHIGFHGAWPDGRRYFGRIRWDNTGHVEVDFPHETGHIHSNDFSLVVGDGYKDPHMRLWRWNGESFDGPRILCMHRSSSHVQVVHVHPRFSPDGGYVVYTSDATGYGNVYQVWVPEFESLPELE